VNLWNVEDNSVVYNLVDMKPKAMDELEEVITHCEFHPWQSSIFIYTTSKGFLNLCDFREASSFLNRPSLKYEVGVGQKKNAFSDLINSLSYGKFLKGYPNHIATRDYLNLRLWDIRSTANKPY